MNAGNGSIFNGFAGKINGNDFLACLWAVREVSDRPETTEYFQVGAIQLAHVLPSVIIRPKVGPLAKDNLIFRNLKNATKVQLEGDFNNNFEVYASSSNPTNAFEFLPPNVMAKLIDSFNNACIELANQYLYLFMPVKGATNGVISLVLEPTFDPAASDAFLNQLLALRNTYETMNQANSQVDNSEVIKDKTGLTIKI